MIAKLFLLYLLILFCKTITISQDFNTQTPINKSLLTTCSNDDLDIVNIAINACEKNDIDNATDCITQYIKANYTGQRWNAFAKNTETNVDVVVFWYFNSCYVKLNNFGQFNRSFIVWPTRNYYNNTVEAKLKPNQNYEHKTLIKNKHSINTIIPSLSQVGLQQISISNQQLTQKPSHKQRFRISATCPQWKASSVKNILQLCDVSGNDHAAECVMNKIKDQMNEYWDVYISTTLINSGMVSWYVQCAVDVAQFGTFSRYINMWRTY